MVKKLRIAETLSVKDANAIASNDRCMGNLESIGKIRRNWNSFTDYEKKSHEKEIKRYVSEINDEIGRTKNEALGYDRYDPNVEADFMEPGNLYNDMPDEPYDNDIKNKDYFNFVVSDVLNRCRDEREARRYMTRNGLPKSFIDDVIEEIDKILEASECCESLREADYGYVHDENEAKLPTSLRSYFKRKGWDFIGSENDSYFVMDFNYGNLLCSIYVDEFGNCYLTTDGDDLRPSDMFYTITETDTSIVDDLITLGNTITSTGDVSSALDVFF